MKLAVGTFLAVAIEANGGDLRGLVAAALTHYRDTLDRAEAIGVPLFLRAQRGAGAEVEVPVSPDMESMLRKEAARQRVAVEALLGHAVFLYLADLDRGGGAHATG
jgi:hypothetical protein